MTYKELVKKIQSEMNAQGERLTVDGDPGPVTQRALENFDVAIVLSRKPLVVVDPKSVLEWARGELGNKEIPGAKDNPRIRWYHTHCANIGSKEHADEVAWCSSFLNAGADECGMKKTDNALASSWKTYGEDTGDQVEAGDIIVLKSSVGSGHVTLANKPFNRKTDKTFEAIGGNQSNAVTVTTYDVKKIVAARKWVPLSNSPVKPMPTPQIPSDALTSGQDADEGTEPWYRRMFAACVVDEGKEAMLAKTLRVVESGMPQYLKVAQQLGARNSQNFAYVLGAIHWKEASCDFRGVLHNGEKIVGTAEKTKLVPAGRGPFATWEEAAIDAIRMNPKRWEKLLMGSEDVGAILYALERYNGTGYITGAGKAENSPYLWACSNINDDKGKYVADGKFDPEASTGATCGAGLILKYFYNQGAFQVIV